MFAVLGDDLLNWGSLANSEESMQCVTSVASLSCLWHLNISAMDTHCTLALLLSISWPQLLWCTIHMVHSADTGSFMAERHLLLLTKLHYMAMMLFDGIASHPPMFIPVFLSLGGLEAFLTHIVAGCNWTDMLTGTEQTTTLQHAISVTAIFIQLWVIIVGDCGECRPHALHRLQDLNTICVFEKLNVLTLGESVGLLKNLDLHE